MNRFEYWFLDIAVEEVIGFGWIVPDDQYGCIAIDRAPLELTIDEIADILHSLFQKGDLMAVSAEDFDDLRQIKGGFIPSLVEIKAALREEINLGYYLTLKGGEQWESVSKPKWNQYFHWGYNVLMCADRAIGERLLAEHDLLFADELDSYIILETSMWEEVVPWQATYWKNLPIGYRVHFQSQSSNEQLEKFSTFDEGEGWVDFIRHKDGRVERQPQTLIARRKQSQEWYDNIRQWYINYFEM